MEEAASGTLRHAARRTAVRPVTAIQAFPGADGRWQAGLCVRLAPGSRMEVCGPGFGPRTVRARCDGAFYFVLRERVVMQNRLDAYSGAA
jgi:hypothetical protein